MGDPPSYRRVVPGGEDLPGGYVNPASSTALYGPRPCERLKQPLGRVSDLIHGCLEGLCIRP